MPPVEGVTTWLPLLGSGPLQSPDAVQLAAVADDQTRVAESCRSIDGALIVSVGSAGATSVKLTEFDADAPAALTQVSV